MNKFLRGACFAAALIVSTSMLFGCKKDYSEELAKITSTTDKAFAIENGEILVNETFELEKDIEGVAENGTVETYVRFSNGPGNPDFELTKTEYMINAENDVVYTFVKSGDTMFELFGGVGQYAENAPDIYEAFRIDFIGDDIKDLTVERIEKGGSLYTLTMNGEYVDKYDKSIDGVDFDCTGVVICYYIDIYGSLTKRTCEIATTINANGESQTMTQLIEAQIK